MKQLSIESIEIPFLSIFIQTQTMYLQFFLTENTFMSLEGDNLSGVPSRFAVHTVLYNFKQTGVYSEQFV